MSYARVERSPRGQNSPLYSSSYAGSGSGSSHGVDSGNPFTSQSDASIARHGAAPAGVVGAGSVGGREFGPYSPLNRRANAGNTLDDEGKSAESTSERFAGPMASSAGGAGAGAATAVDMRGPEPDDYLVSHRLPFTRCQLLPFC